MNYPFTETVWFEIILIFILILINGFFSGSEIAVISSRRSRIDQMAKQGKIGAHWVAQWLKEPEIFLATIQVGVTLAGAMASAIGGAAAIEFLKPQLMKIEVIAPWSEPISIGLVAVMIMYVSLIFGELVPKSLALIFREKVATLVALPIHWFSKIIRALVFILTYSTKGVLLLLGQKKIGKEMYASEEEIRFMIQEGASEGIFDQTQQQMIPKVFDFSEIKVKDLMIPREQIAVLDVRTPRDIILSKVFEEGYTRLPVYQGSIDKIIGILHMKDLFYMINLEEIVILQDLIRPAVFVRETDLAKNLLYLFQKQHLHMAIVQDFNKRTIGLVTLEDLIERIVGDIRDEHD